MGTKVTIPPLGNPLGSSFTTSLNNGIDELADEFDSVLYRDGSQSMTGNLNMNSRRIYNLPLPLLDHEPARLIDVNDIVNSLLNGMTVVPSVLDSVSEIGLFTDASDITIPNGTTVVHTSGYSIQGVGQAYYVYDATIDEAFVTLNPRSSFLSNNGRGFKLAYGTIVPPMFGAISHITETGDVNTTVDFTDDAPALQAMFDHADNEDNAKNNIYNFTGDWPVATPLYCAYTGYGEGVRRVFLAGRLTVLPKSAQPGGVAMNYVLTFGGYDQDHNGTWVVDGEIPYVTSTRNFSNRLYKTAFRLVNCNGSNFTGGFEGRCGKRLVVAMEPSTISITLRSGTDQEITYGYSNNIGIRIGRIWGFLMGSCERLSTDYGHSQVFSAISQGGLSNGDDETSFAVGGSFGGSHLQRTRLTVPSSAEFAANDWIKLRKEVTASLYTTIAADNSAGTITWAAGDPVVDAGFGVGEKFNLTSGSNAGTDFTILSFSGTGNRTIKVYPKPVSQAATAISGMRSQWHYHEVRNVPDATHLDVYPFVPNRFSSGGTLWSVAGGLIDVRGSNTANLKISWLGGLGYGIGLNAACLYGPKIDTMLPEAGEIGIIRGAFLTSVCLGLKVSHIHDEGAAVPLIDYSADNSWAEIGTASNFVYQNIRASNVRGSTTDALESERSLPGWSFPANGIRIATGLSSGGMGPNSTLTLTNFPTGRKAVRATDSNLTITLDCDLDIARLSENMNWAELYLTSSSGGTYNGTATWVLSSALSDRGWVIAGTNPVSGLTGPSRFEVVFNLTSKKVQIKRFQNDKVLGANLVTNGDFPTDTAGWTNFYGGGHATFTQVSGRGRLEAVSGAVVPLVYQAVTTEVGATYELTITGWNGTSATPRVAVGTGINGSGLLSLQTLTDGVEATFEFTATSTSSYINLQTNNFAVGSYAEFDNITVKKVT